MTLYSRRQLALLLGVVVAGGVGIAIGEWRRANPELTATIEAVDRLENDGAVSAPRTVPARVAPSPTVPAPVGGLAAGAAGRAFRPARPPGPIDLNRASADELTRLPGVGPVLAARIVATRDAHGPFTSVDDLRRVSGVGPSKLAGFRDHAVVPPMTAEP